MSGSCRVQQGDSQHRHGELWIARVVTAPEGELVSRSANDNRFVPTADQAVLGEDEVPRLDGGPSAGEVGHDWLARFLPSFAVWIDGGDDFLVQVFPDWRDHRWTGRMDLASRKFRDEIGRPSVGDLDHVEAQLFGGSSRLVGLGMGEPGRVGPPITVEAEHDDFA